ncbi:MAG: 16S rRNA (cytidine(1402)-2'-O)-methyltransferase [Actinomycetota bacterium]|nr:16S rRNA (cytidine(1402)-2'-O)-methyltransferase [Actinomycetota bacterium]
MKKPALVLIGTPIGNLEDISLRASRELRTADAICCEDTRRTGKLLSHIQCVPRPPLIVVNEHNERQQCGRIINQIQNGERLVMVSDAGMPGISDPGEYIVSQIVKSGLNLEVVPGPSAGVTALVGSGISSRRYTFEGFLPRKGAARVDRLEDISNNPRTTVIYESPHRIRRTLDDLVQYLGENRKATVARELTKIHEEYLRGTLGELVQKFSEKEPKGELVIVVEGRQNNIAMSAEEVLIALTEAKKQGLSTRDAVKDVAALSGVSKSKVYELYLSSMRN